MDHPAHSIKNKPEDASNKSPEEIRTHAPTSNFQLQRALSPSTPISPAHISLLQKTVGNRAVTQLMQSRMNEPLQKKENKTGMPEQLKTGVENLSGIDLSDVRVHYGSDKPAQLQALAYAQGNEVHIGPGQEEHLPHEAWHIVQQRQGRVSPSLQVGGTAINDDPELEREADEQGQRAISMSLQSEETSFAQRKPKEQAEQTSASVAQLSNAVDFVLGVGSYNLITQSIIANGRSYNDAPFLASSAQNLIDSGMSAQEARGLLIAMFPVIDRQPVLGRAVGYAAQMRQNNVPYATIIGVLTQHPDISLSQQQSAGVIQLTSLNAWTFLSIDSILQAYAANANGLSLQQWATIAARFPANNFADAVAFSQIANWNSVAIIALAQAFTANANTLTAAEWVTVAGILGNNQHANTIAFAQLANWGAAEIGTLAQAFVNNANGLTAANWITLAGYMGNNAHADTISFAQIPGWNAASILAIAQHFGNNDYGNDAATWTALAARRLNNPEYIRELAHYVGNGWPDQINFNGGVALLGLVSDGIMYGSGNPHVTIHGHDENTGVGAWRSNPEYHVRLDAGSANVYDFVGNQDSFYNNVDMDNAQIARNLAVQFRNEMNR
ncbi:MULTISPECIES: DUF4157 domain-containing protein [unclassified Paenibacillus]|uniref:eCIS core domain-containing protein n=1 Tax=unclassified Paenibacillus TaxID=185978 RepID=UPI00277EDF20|nr:MULTISPECIES: DUF4157 domain-containing protein [unclassified Paenibacillus]MDQ0896327.1 hypothetical protein [Paenibacillus sp. V4I7]MDQ0913747.1 hypothetical protein [Paenibacillus sp. V4I5]